MYDHAQSKMAVGGMGSAISAARNMPDLSPVGMPQAQTFAGALKRFESTAEQAQSIAAEFASLLGGLTGEPHGLTGQSSPNVKSGGTVPALHVAADAIGYALDDISRMVARLRAAHG